MFLLGLAIFLLSAGFFIAVLGGDWRTFISFPSLMIIIIPLAAVLTATRGFNVFYAGLKAAVFPKQPVPDDLRGRAASLFRYLSKTTALVSAVAVLISLCNLLFNLNFYQNPGLISTIGVNIAAALITPFWGIILIAAVFEPLVFILKKRH